MTTEEKEEQKDQNVNSDGYRFAKLHEVDLAYQNYTVKNYNNHFTLEELVEQVLQNHHLFS